MMNFKNHKEGFFLVEAVMALFIAGLILGALFSGIGGLLQNIGRGQAQFERLLIAKNFLVQTLIDNQFAPEPIVTTQKKIDDPQVTISFQEDALPKQSSLAKIPHLRKVQTSYAYSWGGTSFTDNLIYFKYELPEGEKA